MKVIVYYPFYVDVDRPSASQLRPQRMVEGFRELGYEVEVVSGYARERKARCRALRRRIAGGERFDFVYSEAAALPTLLTERHHYPTHPFFDFRFLRFCRRHGMRIGLFYRDVYWAFPELLRMGVKERVAHWFYMYDLRVYNRLVDRLYLPSLRMVDGIPFTLSMPVEALPPGVSIQQRACTPGKREGEVEVVRLLYVGGISRVYDMQVLFRVLRQVEHVYLTLCCRRDEWESVREVYAPWMTERIRVVHMQGVELADLYSVADYVSLLFYGSEYNKFAVSYKLFEALGYGVPSLVYAGGAMADLVGSEGVGSVVERDEASLMLFLQSLVRPTDAERLRLLDVAKRNTWVARCAQVARGLGKRSGGEG